MITTDIVAVHRRDSQKYFFPLMLFISPVHVFTLFPVTALAPVSGVTDGGGGGDVHLLVHHRDHPGK